MARVKNSNCLNFCTQVDLSKTRKFVHLFSSNMFYFLYLFFKNELFAFTLQNRWIAFQRYYVRENLSNVCSFLDSSSSVKSKLCRNQLRRSFQQCGKAMCSLPLQENVGEQNLFFSPCAIMQNSTKLRMYISEGMIFKMT